MAAIVPAKAKPNKTPQEQIKAIDAESAQLGEQLGRLHLLGKGSVPVTYTLPDGTVEATMFNRLSIAAAIKNKLDNLAQARGLLQSAIDRPLATAASPARGR